MNPSQPQRPSRGTYITLLVSGGILLIPTFAFLWFSAGMGHSGDNEGAGFMFMTALCPGVPAGVLLLAGLVALGKYQSGRPPNQP